MSFPVSLFYLVSSVGPAVACGGGLFTCLSLPVNSGMHLSIIYVHLAQGGHTGVQYMFTE